MGDRLADLSAAYDAASTETEAPAVETAPEPSVIEQPGETEQAAEPTAADRARDQQGRFAPKIAETAAPAVVDPKAITAQTPATSTPVAASPDMPPGSLSPATKAEWAKLPPHVREDIVRRENDFTNGMKMYGGLRSYVESAQRAGTTLPEALQRYTEAEQFLERDPVQGLLWLAQNYNVQPQHLMQAMGGQQPQQQAPQGQPQQPYGLPPDVMQRLARVDALEKEVYGSKQAAVESEIGSFISDPQHVYAENVIDQMIGFLQDPAIRSLASNRDKLAAAYDRAVWSSPEIRPLLIQKQEADRVNSQASKAQAAVASARSAGRSITGGPAANPTPVSNVSDRRAMIASLMNGSDRVS